MLCSAACDALPVVGEDGKVVGIITHRDVCAALSRTNQRPSDLTAAQAMSGNIAVCQPTDDVHAALAIMRNRRVRHVPVVNGGGRLEGMMCMSDIVLYARHNDGSRIELSYEDVMNALISIYCHCEPFVDSSA
jgi:CBS domain-containing protein